MREEQLKNLLDSLTVKEKIGQLVQLSSEFFSTGDVATGPREELGIEPWVVEHAGSALNAVGAEKVLDIQKRHMEHSRIPLLFMADVIYGYKTVFPMPLALAATWEPSLAGTCSRLAAQEAAPDGVHVTFAPMVDVIRDARWGRCMESQGEEPMLNGLFAKAMVEGFQGDFTPGKNMASCVKHFAAYGAVESGREYNTVDMSRLRLTQTYLPPYKAAVDAGCEMVMTAFNTIEGIPATANQWLMEEVLRKEWGFDGVLITDYATIQELIAHGVAEDDREAARLAMEATVDIDMRTPCYANQLQPLLEEGKISMEKLDAAVMRILKLKNKLGLFENPYRGVSVEKAQEATRSEESLRTAREAVRKSVVLLENKEHTLPLNPNQKIALIGPYADSRDLNGLWALFGDSSRVVTLKTAFEEVLDEAHFAWTTGCDTLDDFTCLGDFGASGVPQSAFHKSAEEELKKSIELAKWADVVVFAVGEHMMQSGESGSRTDIRLPEIQQKWMDEVLSYAKKSVVLLFNGRPMVLTDLAAKTDAILECWFGGTESAHGIADVVFGKANPEGRLTVSFPYTVGQVPIYYSAFRTGRPALVSGQRFTSRYLDCPNEPLYPFGYGLSYHTAEYGEIELESAVMKDGETLNVSIPVKNTGSVAGNEVVQLYLHDVTASVVRPVKELKAFKKVYLEPGECKKVTFTIEKSMLEFVGKDLKTIAEPGLFEVFIGGNSADCRNSEFRYISEK